jgi:hypothetical protein
MPAKNENLQVSPVQRGFPGGADNLAPMAAYRCCCSRYIDIVVPTAAEMILAMGGYEEKADSEHGGRLRTDYVSTLSAGPYPVWGIWGLTGK